jgi:hypothetical protein
MFIDKVIDLSNKNAGFQALILFFAGIFFTTFSRSTRILSFLWKNINVLQEK